MLRALLLIALLLIVTPPAHGGPPEAINLRRSVTVQVVADTKDAVVNIAATKLVSQRVSDPFWGPMEMGGGGVVRVPANSLGSGFLVHRDGYVVTNHHVIDKAREIHVELADGRKIDADLISSDADADLAVLKLRGDGPYPALRLGDSSDLLIGEPVIAVGNPLGFSHSVSTGIVSALHRDLGGGDRGPDGQRQGPVLTDVIQTDAAINPGNSGGPLLNAYGQVIGINTAVRGDAQNIGFAIQVNKLRDLIPELMNPATVTKVDVPIRFAERRRIEPPATVVAEVYAWTGRDEPAGDDAVAAINGARPADIVDAYAILLKARADERIVVRRTRGGEQTVVAKAVPLPDAIVRARERLGLTIELLTPTLAQRYGLTIDDGLLVTEVARRSIAAKAGLQAGDVIVQMGRYPVRTLDRLALLLDRLPPSGQVRVGVVRGDRVGFGILEL